MPIMPIMPTFKTPITRVRYRIKKSRMAWALIRVVRKQPYRKRRITIVLAATSRWPATTTWRTGPCSRRRSWCHASAWSRINRKRRMICNSITRRSCLLRTSARVTLVAWSALISLRHLSKTWTIRPPHKSRSRSISLRSRRSLRNRRHQHREAMQVMLKILRVLLRLHLNRARTLLRRLSKFQRRKMLVAASEQPDDYYLKGIEWVKHTTDGDMDTIVNQVYVKNRYYFLI